MSDEEDALRRRIADLERMHRLIMEFHNKLTEQQREIDDDNGTGNNGRLRDRRRLLH
jgi:hypothetical protein